MVEGVWGLCGPGRRGHTLLPRMRTFCRGGGRGSGPWHLREAGSSVPRGEAGLVRRSPWLRQGLYFSVPASVWFHSSSVFLTTASVEPRR